MGEVDKRVQFNTRQPPDLKKRVEAEASRRGMSKEKAVEHALEHWLEITEGQPVV